MTRTLPFAALVAGAAVVTSVAWADQTAVSPAFQPARDTQVISTYAGTTMWTYCAEGNCRVLLRHQGRTTQLPVRLMPELDLGPSPSGRGVVAVYPLCTPGCDLYRYDISSRQETRITTASIRGYAERMPTVWGDEIAFIRHGRVLLGSLTHRGARVLMRSIPDEIELGSKHLAWASLVDSDIGNGAVDVALHGLVSGRDSVIEERFIGEGDSTGAGGLSFQSRSLFWQERHRSGCSVAARVFRAFDPHRGGVRRVGARAAPLDVRRVLVTPPETPESEGCGEST